MSRFRDVNHLRARCGDRAADQAARELAGAPAAPVAPMAVEVKPRTKYGNVRVEVAGEVFDSKLEFRVWERLKAAAVAVIRQVSLPIGGGRRIRPDFLVVREILDDGWFVGRFVDAKGMETDAWSLKAELLKQRTGLEIRREKK